jgi:hypothetical protein
MVDLKEFEQKAADLRVLGMKISIGQDTVYEKYWDEDCRRNIYSASKSFTSCAVGFAVQEGLIDLDERLMDAFKEDIPNNPDENLKKATVKDLLTMTLGQEKGFLMGKQRPRMEEQNWVKASLAIPLCMSREPILYTITLALIWLGSWFSEEQDAIFCHI